MSKPATEFDIDQVSLEQITIVKASINNETEFSSLPKEAGFEIKSDITAAVNLSSQKARINFICDIIAYQDETKAKAIGITGNFEIVYIFSVVNLAEISSKIESELVNLPEDLVSSLFNISYSTSRGIIYTRCLGTILGNVILPITSTQKLIPKDTSPPIP